MPNAEKYWKYKRAREAQAAAAQATTAQAGPLQDWELGVITASDVEEVLRSDGAPPVQETLAPAPSRSERPTREPSLEDIIREVAEERRREYTPQPRSSLEDIIREVAEERRVATTAGESQPELPLEDVESTTPSAGGLSPEVMDEYINKLGEAMDLTTRGRKLTSTQRATFERILSDENSLLRMWCEGRFTDWEKKTLESPPPTLTSGVLADPTFTLGADWELPFSRPIDATRPERGSFSKAFKRRLEARGLNIHEGRFSPRRSSTERDASYPKVGPGGTGVIFCYNDLNNKEYGFAVANDNPDGWAYIDKVLGALNDLNQGIGAEEVPERYARVEKGSAANLLAPHPKFGRLVTGWHIHLGPPMYHETAIQEAQNIVQMVQLPVYRLGQHKRFGWRKSNYVAPDRQMTCANSHLRTIEFRPNDTYVETDDPKATFRRFQAQAAYYSGILATAYKPPKGYDYTITGDGGGHGLKVGFAVRGSAKKAIEKINFLATLDLFAHRKAKTTDGQDYDVRRLVYYEWATSKPVASRPTVFPPPSKRA